MPWTLSPHQTLEAPAVRALFFHNDYEVGKQGGLELIQRRLRIASSGNVRVQASPTQWSPLPKRGSRRVESDGSLAVDGRLPLVPGKPVHTPPQGISSLADTPVGDDELAYTIRLAPLADGDGEALRLTVDFAKPVPAGLAVGFNLELLPMVFGGTGWLVDERAGTFPIQHDGPMESRDGQPVSPPLARGRRLVAAPESAAARLAIESRAGDLILLDGRAFAANGWFVVRAEVAAGATTAAVDWIIRPAVTPGWRRPPMIAHSQVGYHPADRKVAVIECEPDQSDLPEARLVRLDHGGPVTVLAKAPTWWGPFLCYRYARFDFSEITQLGLYRIELGDAVGTPFPIDRTVLERAWQPTLDTWIPTQMCHVEVRDGTRVWHGACHLDDAIQAPSPHEHFDGYHQHAPSDSTFAPHQHIPHLDRGGWHDAGDYDLAAGSQVNCARTLALAREVFALDRDQTTVDQARRLVLLHRSDGTPDLVQQVAHGALNLLGGHRACGHSFHGIIESTFRQYAHLGDAAVITDNVVSEGPASDDRWAFTNRDSALEYAVAQTLALSARVLKGFDEALADECLTTAVRVWEFERTHEPRRTPATYVPGDLAGCRLACAAELLRSTGDERYREHLLQAGPALMAAGLGNAVACVRARYWIADPAWQSALREAVTAHAAKVATQVAGNPWGVPLTEAGWRQPWAIWGMTWGILHQGVNLAQLHEAFPDLIPGEWLTAIAAYTLGCHADNNLSLVSGVGPRSATVAYGINRADFSYQPGGVVSAPALIQPDHPEFLAPWPHLWQQTEYVLGGSVDWIFTALAAGRYLEQRGR